MPKSKKSGKKHDKFAKKLKNDEKLKNTMLRIILVDAKMIDFSKTRATGGSKLIGYSTILYCKLKVSKELFIIIQI